ncbi:MULTISPECIES: hypothetical protein [unclassified Variovorax]|uniref:hypothetical protein n=1 Tax=unclassified Variovorax TaxID=663243 RepID=UPI001BD217DE|nr:MULTISPECIES: hypothetical protein [unclassified Variovorax]
MTGLADANVSRTLRNWAHSSFKLFSTFNKSRKGVWKMHQAFVPVSEMDYKARRAALENTAAMTN